MTVNASTQNPQEAESGPHAEEHSDSRVPGQEAGMDVQEPAPANGTEDSLSEYLFYHKSRGWFLLPRKEDGVCNTRPARG